MGKIYLLLLFIVLVFTGCRQDEELKKVEVDSYLPVTTGSEWTYTGSHSYTAKVTGNTKVINGREFNEIENRSGSSVSYSYVKEEADGSYYSYSKLPGSDDYVELNLFNKNSKKGNTWSTNVPYKGQNSKVTFRLEDVMDTYSVNSKSYNTILKVRMVVSVEYRGFDVPVANGNYYYAKGIGLVHADVPGAESILESYVVK